MLDPKVLSGLADVIADIYADAEDQLLAVIAKRLARGLTAPGWATAQLQEISRLRRDTRTILSRVDADSAQEITAVLEAAYQRGWEEAAKDIRQAAPLGTSFSTIGVVDTAAVTALADETITASRLAQGYILRSVDDAYRRAVASVTGRVTTGSTTLQTAVQQALNQLARDGITGFVDRAGRRWQASSYVEMAVRTANARALLKGHTDRLVSAGYDLVVISSHPNPAPMCQPFEGQVLSLSGGTVGPVTVTDALTRKPRTVNVLGSMADAERAGLHHPNCRHTHTLLVPGATMPKPEPYDGQGYDDSQRQRYLERGVRSWKQQELVAVTPEARHRARAGVREWQRRAKEHSDRTGIPRRYDREQVRVGNPDVID